MENVRDIATTKLFGPWWGHVALGKFVDIGTEYDLLVIVDKPLPTKVLLSIKRI